jgi:protein TonB
MVRDVSPQYTPRAMRAAIHGVVRLDCVVGVDGTVGDVRVVRSLDSIYGLDEEAVRAAKQWKFEPGKKDDVAVPVMVTIDMTFAMSASVPAASGRHNTHR